VIEAAPEQYDDRRRLFGAPVIAVAGHRLSPDDVGHGLLGRSRLAWGLGYLPAPAPDGFERTRPVDRVDRVDPRIHLALNRGAGSCPPIAACDRDVAAELDTAARGLFRGDRRLRPRHRSSSRAPGPAVVLGDFGGPAGVRDALREYGVVPDDASSRLRALPRDWSPSLGDHADR
jgi:hypothetical protein